MLLLVFAGVMSLSASDALAATLRLVSPAPNAQELSDAKTALKNGEVVAMQNVKPEVFSGHFNAGLATSHKAGDKGGSYCVIGAAYDSRHVMHTYRGSLVRPGSTDADCMARFQTWADKLNTLQAGNDMVQASVSDAPGNGPAADAWTPSWSIRNRIRILVATSFKSLTQSTVPIRISMGTMNPRNPASPPGPGIWSGST